MKAALLIVPLLFLASCTDRLFPVTPRHEREPARQHWKAPDVRADTAVPGPAVFALALEYPDWADWRSGDTRGGRVVLYRNGVRVRDVPIGESSAPERNRIAGGSIWQNAVEGKTTAVYRDGTQLLRFPGEETILGFYARGDSIHTLGQLAGGGVRYRINGTDVFYAPGAQVLGSWDAREWPCGALQPGADGVYYSYGVPISTPSGQRMEYRVMCGERVVESIPAASASLVYDIKYYNGLVYRLERRTDLPESTCIVKGDEYVSLGLFPGETPLAMSLVPLDGGLAVKGTSRGFSIKRGSVWYRDGSVIRASAASNYGIADMYYDGGVPYWFTEDENGVLLELLKDYSPLPLPYGYSLFTQRCACLHDGALYAALSSASGDSHILICADTIHTQIRFNGYFSSIVVEDLEK